MTTYRTRLAARRAIQRGDPLTAREHDLLRALARGEGGGTLAGAGAVVGISREHTYVLMSNTRRKLGAANTAHAVALAAAQGLVEVRAG